MFALQNAPDGAIPQEEEAAGGRELSEPIPCMAKFDLTLSFSETDAGLVGSLEYAEDVLDAGGAGRMIGHLLTLLSAAGTAPDTALAALPMLTEAERAKLVGDWNDTERRRPDETALALLARRVAEAPERTAVVLGDDAMSYRTLDERSNRLAHHLRSLGAEPEMLVGLYIDRRPELVVGLLAILKAGAAHVPLDPSYPAHRLDDMVQDAGIELVVTVRDLPGGLGDSANRVYIDDESVLATYPVTAPEPGPAPDDLAYMIYTSGSTGRPKGVLIEHRGLANMAYAQLETFELGPRARVLQFSSLSFDISIWETFMALGAGATLCLATRDQLAPGAPLQALLNEQRVTVVTLLPSVLATLSPAQLEHLRVVIAGAEACSASEAKRWAERMKFFNGYGPTEVSVWSTVAVGEDGGRRPPIGRPIANLRCYVLDPRMRLVPVGVAGELYIGGVGVARGYHRRPELTAERFVPDPFSERPDARLYRTGDVVVRLEDGSLMFRGRVDYQVKVRGFRIELGEIESVLREHPAVDDAVCTVHEDTIGTQRIVAYVGARDGALEPAALRRHLAARLPEYMVPSLFTVLSALPHRPNGKVDREALPAPESARPELGSAFVAPKTPLEEGLALIFCEVLGLERVGVHDNFFELGGHSLLATQAVTRVRDTFGVELPLRGLFESPTVAGLAALLAHDEVGVDALEERARIFVDISGLDEREVDAMLRDEEPR
jgi:amino acid adenylation domain-containing protein